MLSKNPNAINLLEKHNEKIKWRYLSSNPNAIHILEANQDKINWDYLSTNPSIFETDVKQMKLNIFRKAKNIDRYIIYIYKTS
jgi:hypothetical protein